MNSGRGARPLYGPVLALAMVAVEAPLPAQTADDRDRVVLTSGKELRGRIVRADDREVVVRQGTRDRMLARGEVRSLSSIAELHHRFVADWQREDAQDFGRLLALAARADADGLVHEARLMRWYALLQRPTDAALHEALGNRRQGSTWLVPIDKEWVPFAAADARGVDFDDAWRLRSEHFAIRCAGGLQATLDTLLELEGLYAAVHELFGRELELRELLEPIEVRLYRDRAQMPKVSDTIGAWFDPAEPALNTYLDNGRAYASMHEATHAILHWQFVRAAKSRGGLPAWLDEGWAEYMQGRIINDKPGKALLRTNSTRPDLEKALRTSELYGLHRVLNFKEADFGASTRQDVKYAQSWGLFRFLCEHDDRELRRLFFDYLRAASRGQGQASTFRKLFASAEAQLTAAPFR